MYLIYNCGYYATLSLQGKHTYKWYKFKKRFITEVNDKDGETFLAMTSKDITWCPKNSKTTPPFMKLENWCLGKEGRFDSQPFTIYDPNKYKELFLLEEEGK